MANRSNLSDSNKKEIQKKIKAYENAIKEILIQKDQNVKELVMGADLKKITQIDLPLTKASLPDLPELPFGKEDAILLEFQKDEELYYLAIDEYLNSIAEIRENGKLFYLDGAIEDFKRLGLTETDFDPDLYLTNGKNGELELIGGEVKKSQNRKQEEERNHIADTLNLPSDSIQSITKIEDKETFSRIIHKNVDPNSELLMVRYDNNQFKIMESGKQQYHELAGIEVSDFSAEIMEQLNRKPGDNEEIKTGTIGAASTREDRYNLAVIKNSNYPEEQIMVEYQENGETTEKLLIQEGESLRELDTRNDYPDKIRVENKEVKVKEDKEKGKPPVDLERYEKLKRVIALNDQIEWMRNAGPDYAAIMGGAAIGAMSGNVLVAGLAGKVANDESQKASKDYADYKEMELESLLQELGYQSIEQAKDEFVKTRPEGPWEESL